MNWQELDEQAQSDLLKWYNVREPDEEDRQRLADLYEQGRFWAWDCPTCGERCYWGDPEDWGSFQGVRQLDYTSYPGTPEVYGARIVSQQCNACRMSVPDRPEEAEGYTGIGEPSCWFQEDQE